MAYDRLEASLRDMPRQLGPVSPKAVLMISGHWAMTEAFGAKPEPVRTRMMGGMVPTAEIVEALHVPFAIVPLVNADNHQHASNENMRMGNYVDGVRTIYGLL